MAEAGLCLAFGWQANLNGEMNHTGRRQGCAAKKDCPGHPGGLRTKAMKVVRMAFA
jgi:hypothetical protein